MENYTQGLCKVEMLLCPIAKRPTTAMSHGMIGDVIHASTALVLTLNLQTAKPEQLLKKLILVAGFPSNF